MNKTIEFDDERTMKLSYKNFVLYDIDYLLDNLAKEVSTLAEVRKLRRKIEEEGKRNKGGV